VADKATPKKAVVVQAYYLIPKNGGFQLRRVHIENDVVLTDEKVSDPDAWNQVFDVLEQELSKPFQ
jgi:hypothetical protein